MSEILKAAKKVADVMSLPRGIKAEVYKILSTEDFIGCLWKSTLSG